MLNCTPKFTSFALYLYTWCTLWTVFFWNIPSQSKSPSRQLPRWTHSSQTVKTDSGMESTLWLLESTINTHKPFLLQSLKPPSRFSSFSAIIISTWPLRNIFAKRIGSMWTVVISWLSNLMRQLLVWEQRARHTLFCRIQVDFDICNGLILLSSMICEVFSKRFIR